MSDRYDLTSYPSAAKRHEAGACLAGCFYCRRERKPQPRILTPDRAGLVVPQDSASLIVVPR